MASEPVLSSTSSAALSSSSSSGHTTTSSLGFSLSTSNAATTNFNHPVQVRLDRNNFLLWRSQLLPVIRGHNLVGFIDGTLSCPSQTILNTSTDGSASSETPSLVQNPQFAAWQRQDQLLLGWILSSLTEPVLAQVVGCTTSHSLWTSLEKLYANQSRNRIMQLRLELQTTKKKNLSISDYLQKLKTVVDNLAIADHPVSDQDLILQILAGLGPEYDSLVVSVSTRSETVTMDDLHSLLLGYEYRLEQHTLAEPITANIATKTNSSSSRPPHNQERGRGSFRSRGRGRGRSNTSFNSNASTGNFTNRPQCQVCSKFGHSALDCFHRFDHGYQSTQTTNSSALMASSSTVTQDDDWYPNSGASNHLTADLSNMSIHSEYQGHDRVKVGNGTGLPIKHVGSSKLPSLNRPLYLNNVLHVPSITKNLISVSQFASDNNVYFEFHSSHCFVKDLFSGQVLLKGVLDNGLYRLVPIPSSQI
ncbi:hypothetical protein CCACVL1_13538 [Corchorus capsularis]|uniref:Uncharacterized protein n=1 Tax=Corchorus capsularis TaxID=210143 RepID=A0A1R3IAV5_COCAP|nr:hypothetical protein CCACVL1_13538 [Corchorus capsularis]